MKKRYLFLILLSLLALPSVYSIVTSKSVVINQQTIRGKINDTHTLEQVVNVLEQNMQAVNEENIDAYLQTLVTSARDDSRQALTTFFDTYDPHITLVSIEVIAQETDLIKLRVVQQTKNQNQAEYRDNQSTNGMTFILEENQWLLAESTTENTEFVF